MDSNMNYADENAAQRELEQYDARCEPAMISKDNQDGILKHSILGAKTEAQSQHVQVH